MATHTSPAPPVLAGTTWLSPRWAVLVSGVPIDLDATDAGGWSVTARAVDPRSGAVVVDFAAGGAALILGTTRLAGGARAATVQLHLSPERTARLPAERVLDLHVDLRHPGAGRDGRTYLLRLVDAPLLILTDAPASAR
ncbi:hypothetical protein Ae168Ps1_6388c [Pseudonocardia sp. Ae168_Ps1]|uniref:hypothetical protein n=1 Tax=unclassified Pseudonocardia TaxID=2619320 RepID=UPI00094AF0E8|nr:MULTISPECIES: hypothetical protein [unclassified Pseudonocardia]OLL69831.1 hypothetical protein Ae150APs1_6242c [Pseudonocardia sp. Ae150A_Ps1]OLL69963.1 hypothetical protein Ae168Ps1_6388c [Pseudonocardia sp. Ae168_Ps1]OLL89124.1 hypothetical protein Ae356Ps1_6241c [Pseudonocardia sp. Ae356_Ps1]